MKSLLGLLRAKHPVAPYVNYKQGPTYSQGANQFVFDQETTLPEISQFGARGRGNTPARNLALYTAVNLQFVPTVTPSVTPPGAGAFYFQPLVQPTDLGS